MTSRGLPADDDLLNAQEAAAKCRVSYSRWWSYYRRFRVLMRGRRAVDANGNGGGRYYWLRSACVEHMRRELAQDKGAA